MKIIWSDKAEEDFKQNIEYLFQEWNEEVVKNFTFEAERVLKIIEITPRVFQKHQKKNVYIVPITKHITLFYDVKRKEIQLLRFWNNFKNPRKLCLK